MNKGKTLLFLGIIILLLGMLAQSIYFCKVNQQRDSNETIYLEPICLTDIQIPLLLEPLKLEKTNDKEKLLALMDECIERKEIIITLIPPKDSVNYYSHKKVVNEEIKNINNIHSIYKERYNKIIYQEELERQRKEEEARRKEEEARRKAEQEREEKHLQETAKDYSVATTIWKYLRGLGYNNYVCAGIMGNIMAEVGGHTLYIQPYLYGEYGGFYGICQWSIKYYPAVNGADLNTQLAYLSKTIAYELNTYGYKYRSGFNYNSFLNLSDASEAAIAFAAAYERCGSATYSLRASNAIKAYNYFVK